MPNPPEIHIDAPNTVSAEPSRDGGHPEEYRAKAVNQIRKWGCHFDGKDPIAFLERVEELQAAYGFTGLQLVRGLPEMLRGDALFWYRNNQSAWDEWDGFAEDFREYYLPRRYAAKLRRDIQARLQGPDEPYRKYATEMLTMMRRVGGYVEEDQLDLLYDNLHPRYKMYVRRDQLRRPADLLRNAEEFEHLQEQNRERQTVPRSAGNTAATAYDKSECCWRCKQRGHTRFECRRAAKKFCSQCGKDGVFTRDCHPPPGNATRTGDSTAAPRSSE